MKYVLYFKVNKQVVEVDGNDIVADENVLGKEYLDTVPMESEIWVQALYEGRPYKACIIQVRLQHETACIFVKV